MKNETFTKKGLNRSKLASLLNTNEKYLVKAVKTCTNLSLKNFILNMRIEYACSLLLEHPDYTIDAIAKECGIVSRSTFYRIFKDHRGCSPNDYRRNNMIVEEKTKTSAEIDVPNELNIIPSELIQMKIHAS
ncbi:helix-turn-helix domain-containing protein [Parabacteroides sp. OttesenSCG-928-G07]|nr:helix-turn-helix domain-containing protein [Parabacteroides sp. OttesenSCG-928-G21]MDL2278081.1 helix-turn-helix domain-containing protein [Parabacteroides sp. OttesenSCG-928-G07]